MNKHLLISALFGFFYILPAAAFAQEGLPAAVTQQITQPLKQVGSGVYTKLGFRVYRATLWTPSGKWQADAPYALQIHYAMSLSKDTLVEAVVGDIHEQKTVDAPRFAQWKKQLTEALPAVFFGDNIIGLAIPDKASTLIYNGKVITTITDKKLSDAFFAIWLGKAANPALKQQLLGI